MPYPPHRSLALLGCLAAAACIGEPSGTPRQTTRYFGADGRQVETLVRPLVVTAGEEVTVRCVVRQNGRLQQDAEVTVRVTPSTEVRATPEGGTFTPKKTGRHHVSCATRDQLAEDLRGVDVDVQPGVATRVDTELEADTTPAGLPVRITCLLRDAYGNVTAQRASAVDAPSNVVIEKDPIGDFLVRGGPAGTWPIACRDGERVDPSPEFLRITPGIPSRSETEVNRATVGPREVVSVTCYPKDAYGNTLNNVATSFYVLDSNLMHEPTLTLLTGGFFGTKAGTYYVFCNAPGYYAVDESPAIITIKPGLPHHWVVDLPEQDCLWQYRPLPLSYVVYDAWNNRIPDAGIILATNPSSAVQQNIQGEYYITEEGRYDLHVRVAGPYDDNAQSLETMLWDVFVDSTPPTIAITSPRRAEALVGGTIGDSPITITGTLTDTASAIESFVLNGVPRTVPAGARNVNINASMDARWGMNVLTASAQDECGNRAVLAQSFLRSPSYYSAATSTSVNARVPQGALAHLNQVVIDDGSRIGLNDLATLGERVLQSYDFNVEIPPDTLLSPPYALACSGTCPSSESYSFGRHPSAARRILWSGPYINALRAVNGGFQFDVSVSHFRFPYRLRTGLCGFYTICQAMELTFEGDVTADWVQATGTLAVHISPQTGRPEVTVSSMNVSSQNLNFRVDCPDWAQWFCDGVTGLASDLTRSFMEQSLADAISAEIPSIARAFLSGFSVRTSFTLPYPLSTTLNVASNWDLIRFCGPNAGIPGAACSASTRSALLGLYTQVYPTRRGQTIPSNARGAIRKDGLHPTFSTSAYSFGLGLRDDLINQILWAAWYSGALDWHSGSLRTIVPEVDWDGITLTALATSPPVLMPGRDGHEIQVGLGDISVYGAVNVRRLLNLTTLPNAFIQIEAYVSVLAGGDLDLDPTTNELHINIAPNPRVFVEVVSIADPGYTSVASDLLASVLDLVLPRLLNLVFISFPLPSFDLSTVPGLPNGVWELKNGSLDRSNDYYRLVGDLR